MWWGKSGPALRGCGAEVSLRGWGRGWGQLLTHLAEEPRGSGAWALRRPVARPGPVFPPHLSPLPGMGPLRGALCVCGPGMYVPLKWFKKKNNNKNR